MTEMIKPSSPTPPQLRDLKLSLLDQLTPPFYIHIIHYFKAPAVFDHHDQTSRKLKQSLSDVLAIYYPLAGRFNEDNSRIHCNDAGVEYVEVRFDDRISDVVENPQPDHSKLRQYVPSAPSGDHVIPLSVQVNYFGCGGTAIGVCMAHKLADAMSMVTFINSWAAVCRGDAELVAAIRPTFGLASRFPPAEFRPSPYSATPPPPPPQRGPIITKIFVFDEQKLAALRRAVSGPSMESPTKVEAVSAFIWSHIIEAITDSKDMTSLERVFAATHVVDIRLRARPSLPDQFFGNGCARVMAMTTTSSEEKRTDRYHDLAVKLREVIRKADADHVKRLEDGDTFMKYCSENEENDPAFKEGRKIQEFCCFTSWHRLPAYDADFGWGKPLWVSVISVPYRNMIFFLGTKSGDGIEAWVNMLEEDIDLIENHYQLL